MVLFQRFGLNNPALIYHELHPEIKFDQVKLLRTLFAKWSADRLKSMKEQGTEKKEYNKCENVLSLPQLSNYPHDPIHVDPSNSSKQVRCRVCKTRWTSWVCSCCRNNGAMIAFCTTVSKKTNQPACWTLSQYH